VVGAAVAQFVYTEKVIGSNPILPTSNILASRDRVMVARLAHNQEIIGSNPVPATKQIIVTAIPKLPQSK
jgi:hypothetical protein